MVDRSKQKLIVINKLNGETIATGDLGTKEVDINNLKAGTDYPEGTYQVAFTTEDGKQMSEKVDLAEFRTLPELMTSFALSQPEVSGKVGDSININITDIAPGDVTNNQVIPTSKDTSIATVNWDNDKKVFTIKLIKAGTTEINWVAADGGGAKVDQKVTVSEPDNG